MWVIEIIILPKMLPEISRKLTAFALLLTLWHYYAALFRLTLIVTSVTSFTEIIPIGRFQLASIDEVDEGKDDMRAEFRVDVFGGELAHWRSTEGITTVVTEHQPISWNKNQKKTPVFPPICLHTVRCRHSTVNFLQNLHNRHLIPPGTWHTDNVIITSKRRRDVTLA